MAKIIDLENEKKFIKNKEHLSKEDYERLAEIETELKEIKKSGKDINVPTKKTNFEKITIEDMAKLISNINCWGGANCFMDICFEDKSNSCDECPFVINNYDCASEVDVRKWLESEVEE